MATGSACATRRVESDGLLFDASVGESEFRAPVARLLSLVARLAKAKAAALRLLDETSGELRLIASVDTPPALDRRTIRVSRDCGVCGDALRNDATRCAAAICACASELATGPATGEERVFVLPLHYRDKPCGVLNLFFSSACEIPDVISTLLPAIGDMLGLALENARLAKQTLHHSLMEERQMLAGEIHDSLAQNLTFMRMRTALLRDSLSRRDETRTLGCLAELDESLALAHSHVRELITDFQVQMDPHGLVHALDDAVSTMDGLGGVRLEFENRVDTVNLNADQERQVFHIVREALANIVKHAQAQHGRLTLEQNEGMYLVTVEDDGIGLPGGRGADTSHGHFGMDIMHERARRIGGRIEFGSRSSAGTRMRLSFPDATVGAGST